MAGLPQELMVSAISMAGGARHRMRYPPYLKFLPCIREPTLYCRSGQAWGVIPPWFAQGYQQMFR